LVAAAHDVALDPARARLVADTQDWPWSSARAHLAGRDDGLVRVAPLMERVGRFADLIGVDTDFALLAVPRDAEGTGRPRDPDPLVAELELLTRRRLRRQTPRRNLIRQDATHSETLRYCLRQ
jgi:putative transposase